MRDGDNDWEAAIVAAFHALRLQAERWSRPSRVVEAADLLLMKERHHDFDRALIDRCESPRLMGLADQLNVETQRYRLPSLIGRAIGKNRRDVSAEHQEIWRPHFAARKKSSIFLPSTIAGQQPSSRHR